MQNLKSKKKDMAEVYAKLPEMKLFNENPTSCV
jgi:hypothetical protein